MAYFPLLLLLSLFVCFVFFFPLHCFSAPVASEFIYPNFTASYLNFVESSGVFLSSGGSASFSAAFYNPGGQSSRFYIYLIHSPTSTAVWTANPAAPVPSAGVLSFTPAGLSLALPDGSVAWSTPNLSAPAVALRLLDSGELRLIDAANGSLWSSFNHPTDTLLPGQFLPAGGDAVLSSATTGTDPTPGDYRLLVTSNDAVLKWTQSSQLYWTLSSDVRSEKDSNQDVAYLTVNSTGLYLLARDKKSIVFKVTLTLPTSSGELLFLKLDSSGRLRILSYSGNDSLSSSDLDSEFVAPSNDCYLPFVCGSLGLCSSASDANSSSCSCPDSFSASSGGGCSPVGDSVLSNSSCPGGSGSSPVSYMSLGNGMVYSGYEFATPTDSGVDYSACQTLCSSNCSCLGFIYQNSSKSCYHIEHMLGSLLLDSSTTAAEYIKTVNLASSSPTKESNSSTSGSLIIILLPLAATILLVLSLCFIGFRIWRRKRREAEMKRVKAGTNQTMQFGRHKSWPMRAEFSDDEPEKEDDISIPGLPTRFTYSELEAATNNFATKIGSGGFGSVYKGQLPDKSLIAVKKINNISIQGKREFCTEIAVIGNIHHVNLVKLRGFCAQGTKRLLIYEYMNRGSLDRSLFGPGPPLEWQERVDIALGAAKALAYLHSGCEHKIIHCDVKPENILLHDHNQVKISDFGLAKLMSPEQSGLFTTMRGTRGYLAPEWLTNSAISDKTDVYSFGMVLLEIVRGRKNRSEEIEPGWTGSSSSSGSSGPVAYFPMVSLEIYVKGGRYEELADHRLEGRVTAPEVERMVKVALCCLHEEPAFRPSMGAVVGMLEGTMPVWEPRVESLNFLRLYGRGFGDPTARKELLEGVKDSSSPKSTMMSSPPSCYISSQQVSGPR